MSLWQLVNQNSYALAAAIVVVTVAARVLRREVTVRSLATLAALAVALVIPVLLLRSPQAAAVDVDAALATGRPVLLELYSDL